MLMFKKGDTLVEVMLAIGIFSMIAIAITAVMSSGSSGAQAALETTLTREEVDTQAEAIRFIQSSYAVDKTAADDTYAKLWKDIIARAAPASEDILQYNPSSCSAVYSESSPVRNYAFVINPRALSTFSESAESGGGSTAALVTMNTTDGSGNNVMQTTSTYPRLVFGSTGGSLVSNGNDNLVRAEGIYVVAVRDQGTSNVIDAAGQEKDTGFYDFYIRSCWYGTDADQPTTISTVIRLYDPDAITVAGFVKIKDIDYSGIAAGELLSDLTIREGRKITLPKVKDRVGWTFHWEVMPGSTPSEYVGRSYKSGTILTNEDAEHILSLNLKGVWVHTKYEITYKTDFYPEGYNMTGTSVVINPNPQICYYDNLEDDQRTTHNCILDNNINPLTGRKKFTASGYRVIGWCNVQPARDGSGGCDSRHSLALGANINNGPNPNFPNYFGKEDSNGVRKMTLYPVWVFNDEIINIRTDWTSRYDYDSYMKLQKPGSNDYIQAKFNTTDLDVTFNGETYSLVTGGQGDGRGSINGRYYESFEIHTLGGKNYYYSVKNWSSPPGVVGNDITVTASGPYTGTYTFRSDHLPSSSCKYWNVFAYIDGEIYERNTCTDSTEIWTP